ncbi:hypothetical protein ACJ5H2_01275 [Nocardioides sp. R1-1]|uniref:hypothetical protein n=1 Tax=Nocardioides sp. R1-1 TaxID=3383502 RepID=UPI0038D228FB
MSDEMVAESRCWTPEVLRALLARWEREDAAGPHLVVAVGREVRYFGPFPNEASARAAAGAEEAAWREEFPGSDVLFEVAPLVDGERLARP